MANDKELPLQKQQSSSNKGGMWEGAMLVMLAVPLNCPCELCCVLSGFGLFSVKPENA